MDIVEKNNAVLRKKAKEVSNPLSLEVKNTIKKMAKALFNEPDGIGLAAPQIDVSLRIFLITNDVYSPKEIEKRNEIKNRSQIGYTAFLNPIVKKTSGKKNNDTEGCLSVRGIYGNVARPEKIIIEYLDENGEKHSRGASNLLARVIQHEMDHLNGILFIDKAKDIKHIA